MDKTNQNMGTKEILWDIHTRVVRLETTIKDTKLLERVNSLETEQDKAKGMVRGMWITIGVVTSAFGYLIKILSFSQPK
jgi:hypothetical protein